jgi:two-component system sensor histidine kinase/response regulator
MENALMARRVLVVDDERVSRLTTQTILEKLGFEVVVLDDGRGAADADEATHFDAIVMDCQMPYVDGFQATAEIRRRQMQGHAERTPIIGLSARAMEGDAEVALSKGMDAYVTKPVSARKLQAALDQVFGQADAAGGVAGH